MTGKAKRASTKKDRPRGVLSRSPRSYAHVRKGAGAFVCDGCGVVEHGGKWSWGAPPLGDVQGGLCPACRRARDRYPAGTLRLPADFLAQREEVTNLIHHLEREEKARHPLERLLGLEESAGALVVTTSGVHLARQIADSLARRFHRKPRMRYADAEERVEVDWEES